MVHPQGKGSTVRRYPGAVPVEKGHRYKTRSGRKTQSQKAANVQQTRSTRGTMAGVVLGYRGW